MLLETTLAMMPVVALVIAQHPGDIFVGLDGSQLITGQINSDQTITLGVRAFQSAFGVGEFDGFTSNPGFDALPGTFDPDYRIGFNILDALKFWNGSLELFDPTGGETLNISFLTLEADTAECFVPGFDLAVQANGGWHRHFSFYLNSDAKGVRDPGIYLLKLDLYYTAPGSINSEPFWLVFNYNDSRANHDAAFEWVQVHLVDPACPADVNFSGAVDVDDLLMVIGAWGDAPCNAADADGNGAVDVDDLLLVIGAWGLCP
jgi:hypothetical protein